MAHRGQNTGSNTVQIWNGTRWVAYSALSFETSIVSVANSLWRSADDEFGHTIATDRREGFSHEYLSGPTGEVFSTRRLFAQAVGQGGGGDPQTLTLPADVLGVATTPESAPTNILVAEFLVAVTHASGSTLIAERYVAAWSSSSAVERIAAIGGITDPNLVVDSSAVGPPYTITVNYNGFPGDDLRYMLDIELKVMGVRP